MSTTETIPFQVDISRVIEVLAKQIYQSPLALLRENCQNAYDAILQRKYLGHEFEPIITVSLTPHEICISDNGIGMTKQELKDHYWFAGSSGKNNAEARAAGVVGTFGIGAMANFGVASQLIVVTESARTGERTACKAERESLSATEDCITILLETSLGQPGTTVTATMAKNSTLDMAAARQYVIDCVQYLPVAVHLNNELVSQQDLSASVARPSNTPGTIEIGVPIGNAVTCDAELIIAGTGEVWIKLTNILLAGQKLAGLIVLRQGTHQIRTYRSHFALAVAGVSSYYGFGGAANLSILEPTAGREALTTASLQVLQSIVSECERFVSERLSESVSSDVNTHFMEWAIQHGKIEWLGNLQMRIEPDNRKLSLGEIRRQSQVSPFNSFEGSDPSLIEQFATDDKPLLVLSGAQPRRRCEVAYLQAFCKVEMIANRPTVLSAKPERDWSLAESSFALRMMSVLEADYFLQTRVLFGKMSHGLPVLIDTDGQPLRIVLDCDSSSISTILKLYDSEVDSLAGMVKDFVRNIVFPKVASFVPSSTRQGAEAFLRAIRRPRDVFEYELNDLGSLSEIWADYQEGKITLEDAARQSIVITNASVQVLDRSAATSVANLLPDVLANERILEEAQTEENGNNLQALPAITRFEIESPARMLLIGNEETALKGYRCFLAITERVRQERGDFFLQPHRTEIVWGGQKALYIFQHHSGRFGLYYELQGMEILSDEPGGRAFPTCTMVIRNQVYIPIPDEIRGKFIPLEAERKRFEVRCELLYPDENDEVAVN